MADILADLTLLSSKSARSKQTKIKQIADFIASDKFKKNKFPMSELHAKLLTLGDVKLLQDMERGVYEN